ncbi:ribonuclease HII [Mycoplasma procyoni]|uniref:ribonuclease HII n=1 Tax=Mycoplasma procyoni TaxID=568784 RepID=UPI00197B3D2F|nr:ribonuclease HII [Mycoplasma procyoni]MBN3534769.1 ribonuclease HII [Mycoplasma procyoni]
MKNFDDQYRKQKGNNLVGCDEVGRGCIAGPVVACCIMLKEDFNSNLIKDSKQIPKSKHKEISDLIKQNALEYHIKVGDIDLIDKINILNATKTIMKEAIESFQTKIDIILVDHIKLDIDKEHQSITKGDQKSLSIAAASIIAKYYRDQLMSDYAKKYSQYNFQTNAGYLTKKHKEALLEYGYSPIHRKTFEPIKTMIKEKEK